MRYELKSRDVAETLDAAFKLYRDSLFPLLGIAALELIPAAIPGTDTHSISEGFKDPKHLGQYFPLFGLWAVGSLFFQSWCGCALTCATTDAYLGKVPTVGGSMHRTLVLTPRILWTGLLSGAGMTLGYLLLVVPGVFLTLKWSIWQPVLVMEGRSGPEALKRSNMLTLGALGRIAWILLLFSAIQVAFSFGVSALMPAVLRDLPVLGHVLQTVPAALMAPIFPALYTIVYFDGRIRDEGWDLEMRAKELLTQPDVTGAPVA